MASSINTANINGEYPVAGQDNSSQGFRDNFTNIKTNLNYAKSEIEDLQSKVVLKEALTGTSLDNNMDGNLIYNVELNRVSMTKAGLGVQSGTLTVDFTDGHYQTFTTGGTVTLAFTGWPSSGSHGELVMQAYVADVSHTIELPAAVTQGLNAVPGISSNVITFPSAGYYILKFTTDDNGSTVAVEYANAPGVAGAIQQDTAPGAVGSAGDTAGMIKFDSDFIYVCTANYDGSTLIWKKAALAAI